MKILKSTIVASWYHFLIHDIPVVQMLFLLRNRRFVPLLLLWVV